MKRHIAIYLLGFVVCISLTIEFTSQSASKSVSLPTITISGRASYPTTGHLNLVTVSYQGCAGNRFNIFTALVAWLNPHQAVVPEGEICPAGQTQKQTQEQDTQEMTSSQSTATAAALTQLHIPYQVAVGQVQRGYPAYGVLKVGDVITAVDGTPEVVIDGKTGFTVPPDDAERLAEAICCLLREPGLRERMGEEGRRWVTEHFSQEQQIRQTQEFYLSAWEQRQRGVRTVTQTAETERVRRVAVPAAGQNR